MKLPGKIPVAQNRLLLFRSIAFCRPHPEKSCPRSPLSPPSSQIQNSKSQISGFSPQLSTTSPRAAARRFSTFNLQPSTSRSAFTLAEVLAALLFLAIVIPVVVEGLSVASRTGSSASRRYQAALIAERLLNESIVMTNWTASGLGGTIRQGQIDYRWKLRTEWWNQDPNITTIRLLSVDVTYPMQGQDHQLTLSTLVDEYTPLQETNQTVAW